MKEDPLETVLRLVSEGRLTAQEALPILEALDSAPGAEARRGARLVSSLARFPP